MRTLRSDISDEEIEKLHDEVQRKTKCLIPDRVGRYIPQRFMEQYEDDIVNREELSDEDIETVLEGPDAEWYWQAWDSLLMSLKIELNGSEYEIFQNQDLYAIEPDLSDEAFDLMYY
jgi:hypothetical protein